MNLLNNLLTSLKFKSQPGSPLALSALLLVLGAGLFIGGCRSKLLEPAPPQGSWKSLTQLKGSTFAFDLVTPTEGWAVTQLGDLALLRQTKPDPNEVGWAVYKTTDGGQTFTFLDKKPYRQIRFVSFATPQEGWGLDEENSILHTADGGQTWKVKRKAGMTEYIDPRYKNAPAQKVKEPLEGLVVVNPTTVFAYGGGYRKQGIEQKGVLLKTADGGQTWQTLNFFFAQNLQTIFFHDEQHGWAYDTDGTLYQTTDGGAQWVIRQTGQGSNLILGIYFVNPTEGWVVGKNGHIRHTTDGGKTWQAQTAPVKSTYRTVFFLNPQQGWAGGDDGLVVGTSDGGQNWYRQESETEDHIAFLQFFDPQTGYAASQNGQILKYQPPQ